MSTFTQFERASLERYLVMFGVGELVAYEPIGEGIENTNYLVTTTQHEDGDAVVLEDRGFPDRSGQRQPDTDERDASTAKRSGVRGSGPAGGDQRQ